MNKLLPLLSLLWLFATDVYAVSFSSNNECYTYATGSQLKACVDFNNGTNARFRVRKHDSSAFQGSGVMRIRKNSITGTQVASGSYSAGSTYIDIYVDLTAHTYPNSTISFYATTNSSAQYSGAVTINNNTPTEPIVQGLSSNFSLKLGQSKYLQGTVYGGSGDTLQKVTAAVTGNGFNNKTAMTDSSIGTRTFNLSAFRFNTSTFSSLGTYTVGIWAVTEHHPADAAIKTFNVTVTAPDKPYVSGLSSNRTLVRGESHTLQGTVYSSTSLDKLTTVTAAVTKPNGSTDKTTLTRSGLSTSSYSLSNFTFNSNTFNALGTYTIGIFANSQHHQAGYSPMDTFTITVTEPNPPTLSNLSPNQTIALGGHHQLQGVVYADSGDRITKVTAAITKPDGYDDKNTLSRSNLDNSSFNLNNFTFNTSTFNAVGTYTIGIFANTNYHQAGSLSMGSFTITVTAPSGPWVTGLPPSQSIDRGQSVQLSGIVNAASADKIAQVTASILYPDGTTRDENTLKESGLNHSTFDLSAFTFNSADFGQSGTYTIDIKVVSHYHDSNSSLGSFTITVNNTSQYVNVSPWAQDAAAFAVENGIIDAPADLDLKGTYTRHPR